MPLQIPDDYGYVAATLVAWNPLNLYLGARVGLARKRLGVNLPCMYASKCKEISAETAEEFNRIQRGHQNMVETLPNAVGMLLVAGLDDAKMAAGLGAVYFVGRILYAWGHSVPPKKRSVYGGILGPIGLHGLMIQTGYFAYKLLK